MKKKNKALLNSNKVCLIKKNTQFVVYLDCLKENRQ